MKLTLKERFVRMLNATGHTEVETRSYKRDVYTNGKVWYFLSARGIRRNLDNNKVTESHNFLERMKVKLKEWESNNAANL